MLLTGHQPILCLMKPSVCHRPQIRKDTFSSAGRRARVQECTRGAKTTAAIGSLDAFRPSAATWQSRGHQSSPLYSLVPTKAWIVLQTKPCVLQATGWISGLIFTVPAWKLILPLLHGDDQSPFVRDAPNEPTSPIVSSIPSCRCWECLHVQR